MSYSVIDGLVVNCGVFTHSVKAYVAELQKLTFHFAFVPFRIAVKSAKFWRKAMRYSSSIKYTVVIQKLHFYCWIVHCVSKKVHPYDVHDNYVK